MKTICLLMMLVASHHALASIDTHSLRTNNGNLVSVGDSYASVVSNMGSSPISTRNYDIEDHSTSGYGSETHSKKQTVTELLYLINNIYYSITVINDKIDKISWDRAN